MAAKFRGALRLSAALLAIALARGDRVRVGVARDGGLDVSRTLAGEGRRADLLAHLAGLDGTAAGGTDLDRSLAAVPPERGGGRRLFLLVSDLLAESDGRSRIAALRGDRVVFHWLHAEERVPPAFGLATLVSAEGGTLEAWIGDAEARRYAAECERWMEGLRAAFGRHGVRYLVTPAERPVEDLVLDVLVKEGVVE
jgi:uncharacterized protein (DUF58 family)